MDRNNYKIILIIAVISLVILTVGQYYGINLIVFAALLCYCFLFILADKKLLFPLLLFYYPWLQLLKFSSASQSGSSFFTIIVLYVIARLAWNIKKESNINLLLIAFIFICYVFIIKFARMEPISSNFIHFLLTFILTTMILSDSENHSDFRICAIYFSIGLLLSGFASFLLPASPNMQQLVDYKPYYYLANSSMTLRQSGFSMDPNFFSSQIIVAIACLLVLFKNAKSLWSMLILVLFLGSFLYLGLSSLSKMFLLMAALILFIWMLSILVTEKNNAFKFSFFILFIIFLIIASNIQEFSNLLHLYASRLSPTGSLDTFTTGRSSIQLIYITYLLNNPAVLLFGQGFSYNILAFAGTDMHNTFIELVYEAGIVGTFLLIAYYMAVDRGKMQLRKMSWDNRILWFIFLISYFLPWFALDIIFFHQFFFFFILLVYLRKYLAASEK